MCSTEPMGRNFHPDFRPQLTPREMLLLGVFGGKYMTDCADEFPAEWFERAKLDPRTPRARVESLRCQRVAAAVRVAPQGLDPPRRSARLVPVVLPVLTWAAAATTTRARSRRWKAMTRHIAQIRAHCATGDVTCRKRQRQALLHWAYDSRIV